MGSVAWVTSNAGLAGADFKDCKSAKLDTLPTTQGPFHAFEHALHRRLGFALGDTGPTGDRVDNVNFNQGLDAVAAS